MTPKAVRLKTLLLCTPLLLAAGCSSFGGGQAADADRLVEPPDLSQERLSQVPELSARRSATLSEFADGQGRDGDQGGNADADASRLTRFETADDGTLSLVIRESYLQGWRRTGLALDRAGFTVEERDRGEGRYVIRYDPGAESDRKGPGFLSRLAFWREREPEYEPGDYVIRTRSDSGATRLTVEADNGNAVPRGLARRLLVLIDEQLR